jgi:hypothetical protein
MKKQNYQITTGLRHITLLACLILLPSSFCLRALGQSYSINWYKVSGGGGTSTNSQYSLSGTIGQQDASAALTGGSFSLTGGFWSIYALQTPGLPNLSIRAVAPNSVVVSWLNSGSYTLQTNSVLTTTNWTSYNGAIVLLNGTNNVTLSPPLGNLFFRLKYE